MDKEQIETYIYRAIVILLILSIMAILIYKNFFHQKEEEDSTFDTISLKEEKNSEQKIELINEQFYIDVKGAVKNPGVYSVNSNNIIQDAINLAGGLKSNASTKNLNLAKKLSSEMVIYIYTNSELKKITENPTSNCSSTNEDITKCIEQGASIIENSSNVNENSLSPETQKDTPNTISNNKININSANEAGLVTLSGIGEAKAKAIIEYRNTNGKFTSIEDIKKVNGISDTIYDKIKENITV